MSEAGQEVETRILEDFGAAIAVRTAVRCGLLRQLMAGPVPRSQLALPPHQGALLLELLVRAEIIAWDGDTCALNADAAELFATQGDDVMARLDFSMMAAADLILGHEAFFGSKAGFMQQADTFAFYAYGKAMGTGPGSVQDTAPWVRHVSALSRREGPVLAPLLPLEGARAVLEIGGNSGAFARSVLGHWPNVDWTIIDLPAVCVLGSRARQAGEVTPKFLPGDARVLTWPAADVVLFKSMLHDWEKNDASAMLARAVAHLPAGGRLIVAERGDVAAQTLKGNLSVASNLVFAQFYREAEWYEDVMRDLGLDLLPRQTVQLDMPFNILCGVKP